MTAVKYDITLGRFNIWDHLICRKKNCSWKRRENISFCTTYV